MQGNVWALSIEPSTEGKEGKSSATGVARLLPVDKSVSSPKRSCLFVRSPETTLVPLRGGCCSHTRCPRARTQMGRMCLGELKVIVPHSAPKVFHR